MPKLLISDILIPDAWNEYGIKRTMELSALYQSGIVGTVQGVDLPNGGGTVNMPQFNDLTGALQNLSDSASLSVNNISTGRDVAVVIGRGQAWSVNDLPVEKSGADPVKAIMDLIAGYWSRQLQVELLQVLAGALGASTMSANVSDITAGSTAPTRTFNASTFMDACYLLGDAQPTVTAVAMHSATMLALTKANLITFIPFSDQQIQIPTFMGKRVIVDDGLPVSSGNYTSYIFGESSVGFTAQPIGEADLETDRDILAGDTVMTMRMRFLMHPRGIRWTGTAAGAYPTRTELATTTNWAKLWETKQIRMIAFRHKIV